MPNPGSITIKAVANLAVGNPVKRVLQRATGPVRIGAALEEEGLAHHAQGPRGRHQEEVGWAGQAPLTATNKKPVGRGKKKAAAGGKKKKKAGSAAAVGRSLLF